MKGKLHDYASLAEIVGAVGVIVSLVYVGLGVRQNTEAVKVANHQALVTMDIEKNAWFRDPAFATAYVQALDHPEKLSPVQQAQVATFIADTLNAWEFAYITHLNGQMGDNIWNGWDGYYLASMKKKPFLRFWHDNGQNFSPRFRAYVDAQLKK